MATETVEDEGWNDHLRGLTVTTTACLLGLAAGVASTAIATGPKDRLGLVVAAGAVVIQLPLYWAIGIQVEEFGAKEYLYIAFMTVALWFISWGILLTTGTAL
jgi:hypothetical protein